MTKLHAEDDASQYEKSLSPILSGCEDKNISFRELCQSLEKMGFLCRVKGDHYIFTKDDIEEIINIQPIHGKAKSYQVKQVREIILKYRMGGGIDE